MFINKMAHQNYEFGWNPNGEWQCRLCGTIIGKNLNGDKPFALAREHANQCGLNLYVYSSNDPANNDI